MPPPRVVIATRLFPPEVGAAAFREKALAEAFVDAGYAVDVVTTRPPPGAETPDDGALRVRRWPVLRDATGNIRGYLQYLTFDLALAVRLLARRRPDLYVAEPPPTTGAVVRFVAAVHRRPYAWYAADVWSDAAAASGAPRAVVRTLRAIETGVLRGAAVVLSVSEGVTQRCLDVGVSADRVVTVGNGVDTEVFRPEGERQTDDGRPYLVYAGTMSEWQGASVFVHALRRHRDEGGPARLVFLGEGSERASLERLAARLVPGAVDFHGLVSPAEAARWLRGARAALVSIRPGQGYDFARPTKIFAATACGTPVIFAGRGAGATVVEREGLGWAVDHDAEAVAAAINESVSEAAQSAGQQRDDALVAWTQAHASLAAAGSRAVSACTQRLRPGPD